MLLSLLVLAACSDTPEVAAPGDAGTNVASFQFAIDPGGEQVSVTQLEPAALGTQQFTQLDPDTQLKLKNARYIFGANNTLTIKATFTNVTSNTNFLQPFSFGPATSPQGGNYLRSSEPTVTDADLGGDGVLAPGETTATLTFTVKHKGERFSYRVNAYAEVEQRTAGRCGADGVLEGSATIENQADVNALGNCREIEGSLFVTTDAATLDFSPLDGLQRIGTFLNIRDSSLTSLSGFGGLTSVNAINIADNPSLISVSGFGGLESGNLAVANNPALTSISGFGALSSAGVVSFQGNPALTSLPDFRGLSEVSGNLIFRNNDALASLPAFGGLDSVGVFEILDNDSLTAVSGFPELSNVDDNFFILNNASLASVSGLRNARDGGGQSSVLVRGNRLFYK